MEATFDTTEQRILKIIDDNRETIVEFEEIFTIMQSWATRNSALRKSSWIL